MIWYLILNLSISFLGYLIDKRTCTFLITYFQNFGNIVYLFQTWNWRISTKCTKQFQQVDLWVLSFCWESDCKNVSEVFYENSWTWIQLQTVRKSSLRKSECKEDMKYMNFSMIWKSGCQGVWKTYSIYLFWLLGWPTAFPFIAEPVAEPLQVWWYHTSPITLTNRQKNNRNWTVSVTS